MTEQIKVETVPGGFRVAGDLVPFRSGAFHYWRVERSFWGRCLDRVKDMGLPIVETYVPWAVHEIARGGYDFGEHDPQKDLPAFLEECASRGLWVILRPGPHINAEMTHFGIPGRVLGNPACQARTARGAPALCPAPPRIFPIPSYAQEAFYQEVGEWFSVFARAISPYLGKPVIALQVDNELSYFFRTGVFDLDYSEGAIALYRSFLRNRYQDKARAMAAAYGSEESFDDVEPPRRFSARTIEDLPRYLDWAAFKRYYLVQAVSRLKAMLIARGLGGLAFFHNFPPAELSAPFTVAQMEEKLDFVGLDLYHRRQEYEAVKRRVLCLAGTSRLPSIPECGLGGWLAWQSFTPEDNMSTLLGALMHGARGINLYMAVDRERWYGAPISRDGKVREPLFTWVSRLMAALKEVSFETLTREGKVALLAPREYADLAAVSSVTGPLPPVLFEALGFTSRDLAREDTFGLRSPVQQKAPEILEKWQKAFSQEKIPFFFAEGDAPAERLAARRVLCVPTLDFFDEVLASRLFAHAEQGNIVVIGPNIPDLNARLLPGAPFAEVGASLSARRGGAEVVADGLVHVVSLGAGEVWLVEEKAFAEPGLLARVVDALAERASLRPALSIQGADSACFRDEAGALRVLFLASAKGETCQAEISGERFGALYDPITEETFLPEGEVTRVEVAPWTVRLLLVRGKR